MINITAQKNGSENSLFDYWHSLKAFTAARIALGRTGTSVPLSECLDFKLAHAHARDAVYSVLDANKLCDKLMTLNLPVYHCKSKAAHRAEYLQRPDLGRRLNMESAAYLQNFASPGFDVAVIVADGLSASAINMHAFAVLKLLVANLKDAGLTVAPLTIVEQARVAVGDQVGELLKAQLTIILIGERPGLSSTDSLGAYLTYLPKIGLTDESRNCVSNIRPVGLGYEAATGKIFYLVKEALRRRLSGVRLKEETSSKHLRERI